MTRPSLRFGGARRILAISVLVAGLCANVLAQPAGFMTSHDVEALGDGLYTFRFGPYRNIFLIGEDGVIVTDPISTEAAAALRSEIARLTDLPVTYVAYSHSHWDHAKGGGIFKSEGARFVAQERCRDNIEETPRPDLVPPDIVFENRIEIDAGGRSLEMHYFGPNHSDCLSVMVARPANIAFIVDLANPPTGWHVEWNPTAPDTHFWNLVHSLAEIEAYLKRANIETFVGGHVSIVRNAAGRPAMAPAAGSVKAVTERRMFWETAIRMVADEMATGTFADQVPRQMDRSELARKIQDYNDDDMAILSRRIASYVFTGF